MKNINIIKLIGKNVIIVKNRTAVVLLILAALILIGSGLYLAVRHREAPLFMKNKLNVITNNKQNGGFDCSKVYRSLNEALKAPENVCKLNLFNKKIRNFPMEVLKLKKLRELNLAGNELTSVPAQISELKNLEVLYLGNNQIEKLPPEIGKLTNLKMLSLFFNKLSGLPPTIKNLTRLELLGLHGNKISKSEQRKIKLLLPKTTKIEF